jgi:hypothetical protein
VFPEPDPEPLEPPEVAPVALEVLPEPTVPPLAPEVAPVALDVLPEPAAGCERSSFGSFFNFGAFSFTSALVGAASDVETLDSETAAWSGLAAIGSLVGASVTPSDCV